MESGAKRWQTNMSMRKGRVLIYVLGGICVWVLLVAWNQKSIKRFQLETIRQGLVHHARLVQVQFDLNPSAVGAIGEEIAYRIEIISQEGQVVTDSLYPNEDFERTENQLDSKELQEASREGVGTDLRYYSVTDGWFLYVAVPASTGGFIRLSTPVSGPEPSSPEYP